MKRLLRNLTLLNLLAAAPLAAQANMAAATAMPAEMERVRAALDRYKNPINAVHDGYFSTLACMAFPSGGMAGETMFPAGAMGVHFLNLGLVGQPLDTLRPQVLIYEPVRDSLRLVAAEWFVPVAASAERPSLFGHPFDGPMDGHAPIMPPELRHWDLHVWLWKDNPAGLFTPTNPQLRCPNKPYTSNEAGEHHH